MERRINTPKRRMSIRALALGLTFALVLPLAVVYMQAQAADDDRSLVDGKDLYTREADANTMDSYAQATLGGFIYLNRTGGFSGVDGATSPTVRNNFGSRYAGEVWADKSVFARYQPHIAEIRPFEEGKSYTSELTELDSLGIDISGVTAGKPLTVGQAEELNNAVNALMEKYLNNFNPDNPTASGYKFQGDGDFDGRTLQLDRYTDGVNSSVTMNDDSDFLQIFSALGSSQVVNDEIPIALDVVFVLDTSASMSSSGESYDSDDDGTNDRGRYWTDFKENYENGKEITDNLSKEYSAGWNRNTRLEYAADALNTAFDTLMTSGSPYNRVALVTFDKEAREVMSLGRYEPNTVVRNPDTQSGGYHNGDTRYFTIAQCSLKSVSKADSDTTYDPKNGTLYQYDDRFPQALRGDSALWGGNNSDQFMDGGGKPWDWKVIEINAKPEAGGTGKITSEGQGEVPYIYTQSATSTQQGILLGMKMLANEEETTIKLYRDKDGKLTDNAASGKYAGELRRRPIVVVLSDGAPNPDKVSNQWWSNPSTTEGNRPDSAGVALLSAATAAYQKKVINEHYFKDTAGMAWRDERLETEVYTFGVTLADPTEGSRYDSDGQIARATLNPAGLADTGKYVGDDYDTIKKYRKDYIDNKSVKLGTSYTMSHPIGDAAKYDIQSEEELNYPKLYTEVDKPEDLPDIFRTIFQDMQDDIFTPVGGTNSSGIEDSLTYMDPIGDYMTVDDVTDVTMFGEQYKVSKRAVYDYAINKAIIDAGGYRENDPTKTLIKEGWYDAGNKYYGTTPPSNNAWEDGYVYRVTYATAQQYIPTLAKSNGYANLSEKQKNTTYTIYSITEQYQREKPDGDVHDSATWRVDKTRKTTKISDEDSDDAKKNRTRPNHSYDARGATTEVTFDLLDDIKIWVEDTGEYRDVGVGGFVVDSGYGEALYINIGINALPVQVASVTLSSTVAATTPVNYETNISDTWASTPLRVYYNVSFDRNYLRYQTQEYTKALNKKYAVGVALTEISSEYLKKNTSTVFTKGKRQTAFYSNYFTDSTYNEYPVTVATENISRGNPAVTFAVSNDNQFYRFQKNRVLFLIPGVDESEARPVEVDLGNAAEVRKIGDPTTVDGLQAILNKARRDNHTYYSRYDCIPVTGARNTKVKGQDGNELIIGDQISSDNWYYIIREYYVPIAWDGDGSTKNVELHYRAIARKGSEFGSGLTKGGSMGSEVQWYNPNLPYGENTSPFISNEDHWGRPDTHGWYVAARPGGLRVGGLENFVGTKGYDIREGADMVNFEKDPAVIENANLTDTALNYFVPTISSYTGNDEENVAVNLYLGNNGRILVDDSLLIVTKTVNDTAGGQSGTEQQAPGEKFEYRVKIEDFYGTRGAVMLTRDEFDRRLWRRRFDTIDLLTDNRNLLLADDNNLAMVDREGHRVFKAAEGYYYYNGTNEDGTFKTDGARYIPSGDDEPYYVYLGQNIRRGLYNDKTLRVFKADVTRNSDLYGNQSLRGGMTFYLTEEQYEELPAETKDQGYVLRADDNDISKTAKAVIFRIIDENGTGDGHDVGDREYWVNRVYLIPVTTVDNADAGGTPWAWEYSAYEKEYSVGQNFNDIDFAADYDWRTGYGNGAVTERIPYTLLTEFTVATLRAADNSGATSQTELVSEGGFNIRSNYLTTPVTFNKDGTATVWLADGEGLGFNNINFGSDYAVTEILEQDDVYFQQISHVQGEGSQKTYLYDEDTVVGKTDAYEQAVHYTNYYRNVAEFEPEPGEDVPSISTNPDIPSDKLAGNVPETGDDSRIGLLLSLMALSMGGIVAIIFYYVKRTRPFRPKDKDQNN